MVAITQKMREKYLEIEVKYVNAEMLKIEEEFLAEKKNLKKEIAIVIKEEKKMRAS